MNSMPSREGQAHDQRLQHQPAASRATKPLPRAPLLAIQERNQPQPHGDERRQGDAAGLANASEMDSHQCGQHQRQDHHVQQIEADQSLFAHGVRPENQLPLQAADVEDGSSDACRSATPRKRRRHRGTAPRGDPAGRKVRREAVLWAPRPRTSGRGRQHGRLGQPQHADRGHQQCRDHRTQPQRCRENRAAVPAQVPVTNESAWSGSCGPPETSASRALDGDRVRRTAHRTQGAADAPVLVFENGRVLRQVRIAPQRRADRLAHILGPLHRVE